MPEPKGPHHPEPDDRSAGIGDTAEEYLRRKEVDRVLKESMTPEIHDLFNDQDELERIITGGLERSGVNLLLDPESSPEENMHIVDAELWALIKKRRLERAEAYLAGEQLETYRPASTGRIDELTRIRNRMLVVKSMARSIAFEDSRMCASAIAEINLTDVLDDEERGILQHFMKLLVEEAEIEVTQEAAADRHLNMVSLLEFHKSATERSDTEERRIIRIVVDQFGRGVLQTANGRQFLLQVLEVFDTIDLLQQSSNLMGRSDQEQVPEVAALLAEVKKLLYKRYAELGVSPERVNAVMAQVFSEWPS